MHEKIHWLQGQAAVRMNVVTVNASLGSGEHHNPATQKASQCKDETHYEPKHNKVYLYLYKRKKHEFCIG